MDIVVFGQQEWSRTWTEKQQYSTRLARRGHRVLYVDPEWSFESGSPIDRLRALAPVRAGMGLRELHAGSLYVFTYPYASVLRWRVNNWRYPRVVRSVAARLGFRSPVVLAFHPSAEAAATALKPATLAYYAVDEYTAYGTPSDEDWSWMRGREETLLRASDVAFGVSPRLVERFAGIQPRSFLLENGLDPAHFARAWSGSVPPHPEVARFSGPRIGLVGQIDHRVDQALLAALARSHREWSIVLIGRVKEGTDVSALVAEPNVHFVPFQPYDALPAVLRALDVCLVPYLRTVLTHSCNPAKIYEYIAADRPVVATPLDGIVACRRAVTIAEDAEGFERAIVAALTDPSALREERRAVVEASDWEQRTDELERRLEEAFDRAGERTAIRRQRAWPGARVASIPAPAERWNDYWRAAPGQPMPPLSHAMFHAARAAGWLYYAGRVMLRIARGERPARIRRILVVRTGTFMGDLIVFLPLLSALRERFPHAHIVLGVQPGLSVGALLDGNQDVDEVRELDFLSAPNRVAQISGALRLFAEGFDAVVSGVGYFVSRDAMLSGAPFRVGLYDGTALQTLNRRALPLDVTRHEAANNLALVELLSGQPEDPRRSPRIEIDPAATGAAADGVLAQLGIPAGAPILAVHSGSKKPSRRWPADRFAAVVARLLGERPDLWVVFTGTPGERDVVEAIREAVPEALRTRAPSSIGLTDLPALIGLLDRSAAVLSNDTGVMHLARARGTPLLALLGPDNDRRWGPHPWGPGRAVALRYQVPCSRCARHECEALFCMLSLEVDEVLAELRSLLDGARYGDDASADNKLPIDALPGSANGNGSADAAALVPLVRRVRQRSWRTLAEAGFQLPLVSVIVPADAGAEVLADVERQDYPHIEILRLNGAPASPAGRSGNGTPAGSLPVRSVGVAPDSAEAVWGAVLEAARGDILAFHPRDVRWPVEKISADVAALMREPDADVTAHGSIRKPGRLPGRKRRPKHGEAALRRSWLAARLAGNGFPGKRSGREGVTEWLDTNLHTAVRAFADAPAIESGG